MIAASKYGHGDGYLGLSPRQHDTLCGMAELLDASLKR